MRLVFDAYNDGVDTKSTLDFPQGLIITVALDPSNTQGSTDEALRAFEFDEVPIKESSGH